MKEGEMRTLTQTLTDESVEAIAKEFDRKDRDRHRGRGRGRESEAGRRREGSRRSPPVITVMGHWTTARPPLLDAIRRRRSRR